MRKIFPVCCAVATAPPSANARAIATIPTHFRFWIADFRLSDKNRKVASQDLLSCFFSYNPKSKIENLKSLNDLVRPIQHRLRNRQADLLRRLEIDH